MYSDRLGKETKVSFQSEVYASQQISSFHLCRNDSCIFQGKDVKLKVMGLSAHLSHTYTFFPRSLYTVFSFKSEDC